MDIPGAGFARPKRQAVRYGHQQNEIHLLLGKYNVKYSDVFRLNSSIEDITLSAATDNPFTPPKALLLELPFYLNEGFLEEIIIGLKTRLTDLKRSSHQELELWCQSFIQYALYRKSCGGGQFNGKIMEIYLEEWTAPASYGSTA